MAVFAHFTNKQILPFESAVQLLSSLIQPDGLVMKFTDLPQTHTLLDQCWVSVAEYVLALTHHMGNGSYFPSHYANTVHHTAASHVKLPVMAAIICSYMYRISTDDQNW